jgi:hypothetical protein
MHGQPKPSNSPRDQRQTLRLRSSGEHRSGIRWLLPIVVVASLCVITAGIVLATFFSSGGGRAGHLAGISGSHGPSPSQAQASAPQPTATANPAGTAPKVATDKAAKHILTWPPRLNHQVRRWAAGAGGTALARVETDMGTAMQSAGLKLYLPMRQACLTLASDVSTARAGPPVPDGAIQQLYLRALAGLSRAAAHCQAAIRVEAGDETLEAHVNQPLLTRTRLEMAAMSEKLYRSTAALRSLHR